MLDLETYSKMTYLVSEEIQDESYNLNMTQSPGKKTGCSSRLPSQPQEQLAQECHQGLKAYKLQRYSAACCSLLCDLHHQTHVKDFCLGSTIDMPVTSIQAKRWLLYIYDK